MGIFVFDVLDFSQLPFPCVHPKFALVQIVHEERRGNQVCHLYRWQRTDRNRDWQAMWHCHSHLPGGAHWSRWPPGIQRSRQRRPSSSWDFSMASMAFSPMGMVPKAYHPYEWCLSPTYNNLPLLCMIFSIVFLYIHAVIDFSFFQLFLSPTKNCCESQKWMTLFNSSPIDLTSPAFDQHGFTTHGVVLWSRVT